jgi:hypothetical protein
MKELMTFRDKVFKFVEQDWYDAISRAGSIWTPRWRDAASYAPVSSNSIRKTRYSKPSNTFGGNDIVGIVVSDDDTVLVKSALNKGTVSDLSLTKTHPRVSLPALAFVADSINTSSNNDMLICSLSIDVFMIKQQES